MYGSNDSGGEAAKENIWAVGKKQGRSEGICNGCFYGNTAVVIVYVYLSAFRRDVWF